MCRGAQAKEQAEWNAQQKRAQAEEEGQADQMEQAEQFLKLSTAKLTKVRAHPGACGVKSPSCIHSAAPGGGSVVGGDAVLGQLLPRRVSW